MQIEAAIGVAGSLAGIAALGFGWPTVSQSMRERRGRRLTEVASVLRDQHAELAEQAFREAPTEFRIGDLPMLGRPEWIAGEPWGLDAVELELQGESPAARDRVRRRRDKILGGHRDGAGRRSYSSFLRDNTGRAELFDGRIYRLVDVTARPGGLRLRVAKDQYFNYLDSSEILAFEAQSRRRRGKPIAGKYRSALGEPWRLADRVAGLGIGTLTIRAAPEGAAFILHHRTGGSVVHNAGRFGVAPGGEFAPSDLTTESLERDLDIWRNQMREYAEEFLGMPEAQSAGGAWIDYENDEPYRELESARAEGRIRFSVLGLVFDPLTWKPNLLTVCVIDADRFDRIFADMVSRNDEGELVVGRRKVGLPFDSRTVASYCADPRTTPVASACLQLAWQHRDALGLSPAP